MKPNDEIRAAWSGTNRLETLNRVVERLASEGFTREALEESLCSLLNEERARGITDEDEESIASVGDRLRGWCHETRLIGARSEQVGAKLPSVPSDVRQDSTAPSVV